MALGIRALTLCLAALPAHGDQSAERSCHVAEDLAPVGADTFLLQTRVKEPNQTVPNQTVDQTVAILSDQEADAIWYEILGDKFGNITSSIDSASATQKVELDDAVEAVGEGIRNTLRWMRATMIDQVSAFANGVHGTVMNITTGLQTELEKLEALVVEEDQVVASIASAREDAQAVANTLLAPIEDGINDLQGLIMNFSYKAREVVHKIVDDLHSPAAERLNHLVSEGLDDLVDMAQKVLGGLEDVKDLVVNALDRGTEGLDSRIDVVQQGLRAAAAAGEDFASHCQMKIGEIVGALTGSDVSFASGVTVHSNLASAQEQVKTDMRSLLDAFHMVLPIVGMKAHVAVTALTPFNPDDPDDYLQDAPW